MDDEKQIILFGKAKMDDRVKTVPLDLTFFDLYPLTALVPGFGPIIRRSGFYDLEQFSNFPAFRVTPFYAAFI